MRNYGMHWRESFNATDRHQLSGELGRGGSSPRQFGLFNVQSEHSSEPLASQRKPENKKADIALRYRHIFLVPNYGVIPDNV